MYKKIYNFVVGLILFCDVALAANVIFDVNTNIHRVGIVVALTSIICVINSFELQASNAINSLSKDLKLVEFQELILAEVRKNNKQVINLITSSSEMLEKMTGLAMKKEEKNGSKKEF